MCVQHFANRRAGPKGLSEDLTAAHPQIPWHQVYGLRNRIVHDYEGVQLKIIWDTITQDFKPLSDDLKGIMGSHAQKH
ncbi:MAG: DUF86 domain-containing protein [Clostridiales bacterium]|nr:DUF86 domain-containing protein [Clostridiales bacterium]